jgi:hypothetical protein
MLPCSKYRLHIRLDVTECLEIHLQVNAMESAPQIYHQPADRYLTVVSNLHPLMLELGTDRLLYSYTRSFPQP